jgi:hypothetical protein
MAQPCAGLNRLSVAAAAIYHHPIMRDRTLVRMAHGMGPPDVGVGVASARIRYDPMAAAQSALLAETSQQEPLA